MRTAAEVLWIWAPRAAAVCRNPHKLVMFPGNHHHLAIKYLLDIVLMTHLIKQFCITIWYKWCLPVCFLLCENQTVIVERYYTVIGTREKSSAKFMPLHWEILPELPESFSPQWKDVASSWPQRVPTASGACSFTVQVYRAYHEIDVEGGVTLLKLARVKVWLCSPPMSVCSER